jgi:hypothetical protein
MFVVVCIMILAASNSVLIGAAGRSVSEIYWRFISGLSPIGSSLGHAKQTMQVMQIVQSRINTGYFASR